MNISQGGLSKRDQRALALLAAALVLAGIIYFATPSTPAVAVSAPAQDAASLGITGAEGRLARMRQVAAGLPAEEATLKQISAALADREHGLIQGDTAAQAQAELIEIARRAGKNDQIDIRGGDFSAPRVLGDYGLVYATITFDCHIEQLINFLADLSQQPELIAPSEERITSGNAKDKTIGVRMVLAGVVAKKLVPEKKGLAAF